MIAEPAMAAGEDAVRVRGAYGFRIVTSRPAKPQELERIMAAYRQHLEQFRAHPDRAAQAIEGYAAAGVDAAEQAAWTLVANALLNLDETITKE
jgi:hypothetical protein